MEKGVAKVTASADGVLESVEELCKRVAQYSSGDTSQGVGLLDVKSHALLKYTASLCRYAASRVAPAPEDDIPQLKDDLVTQWVVLDRVRPMEKKLRPYLETILKRAAASDTSAARPRPGNFVADSDEDASASDGSREDGAGGADGDEPAEKLYKAPRIAEVVYDGDEEQLEARAQRKREKLSSRLSRNRGVRDMIAEVAGRPEEVRDDGDFATAGDSRQVDALRREEEERLRYEEENFTRLTVTRKDKKRRRVLEKAVERSGGSVDAGGDPFADLMGVADRVIGKSGSANAEKRARGDRVRALDELDRVAEQSAGGRSRKRRSRKR